MEADENGAQASSSKTAYMRIAALVSLLLIAYLIVAQRTGDSTSGEAPPDDGTVSFEPPPAFVVAELPAEPEGSTLFADVTAPAGIDAPHSAKRVEQIELPRGQLAALMGTDELTPDAVRRWASSNMSPFITEHATLTYYATGQAWGDVNGNGRPDLYVTNHLGPNHLYLNNGDGTFDLAPFNDDVALEASVSGGATFVDFDNDGWTDLHVLNDGPDVLLRNEQGQGFADVTAEAGVAGDEMGMTASWADFDGDGNLDVYVTNYGCQPCNDAPPVAEADRDQDRLYRNVGDGTFEDVTDLIAAIPATRGLGFAAAWVDVDRSGRPDLYVVNDVRNDRADDEVEAGIERGDGSTPGNALLRNEGPGCGGWCFRDVSEETGSDVRANSMGVAVGDVDGDGWFDMFFTNSGYDAGPAKLLRNLGSGRFEEVSADLGANLGEWSWGTNFLDVDNDGRLDLFVAVGLSELAMHASIDSLPEDPAAADPDDVRARLRSGDLPALGPIEPSWPVAESSAPRTDNDRVLLQVADGRFVERVLGDTKSFAPASFGSAAADFDGDGWVDLVVGDMDRGYRLLRNQAWRTSPHRRISVEVIGDGRSVSRDAVGTVVSLVDSRGRTQHRDVRIGASFGSGDERVLHFGLGDADAASLIVSWPDGTTSTFDDVPSDSRVTIEQGESGIRAEPLEEPSR